ncbi:MAG: sensor histidine kinase [Pseudomonadota bacterium]
MSDRSFPLARPVLDAFCRVEVYVAAMVAGEGVAILLALAPGVEGERWGRLGLASLFIQWVALGWVAALCLGRRWLARLSPGRVAWLAVLALQLVSLLVGGLAHGILGDLGARLEPLPIFLSHVAAMALVVGVTGVMGFYAYWRAHELALRAKDAELEALHARIRPHFLFNTLNTIASLVPTRPAEAEQMVESLARMLRAALEGPRAVLLADELALVRAYLAIESTRLDERLRVQWVLPEPLPAAFVPSLSVQPLVENAVRYGVEPARRGGEILISVEATAGEGVRISVRNSVPPDAPAETVAGGSGMALENVRARLEALFGSRGGLAFMREGGVFEVRLDVPRAEG